VQCRTVGGGSHPCGRNRQVAIISFSHNFIFIKTRKTASTSLEVHLAQECTDEDIITPIYPGNPTHRPRNHVGQDGLIMFYNHMPATEIRDRSYDSFDQLYKFGFERHPVDKCLSHFAMFLNSPFHHEEECPTTWEDYLERGQFPIDSALYTDGAGKLIIDKLYKYEEITAALADIAAKIGIKNRALTAREKSGFRYNVPSFHEIMGRSDQCSVIWKAFESMLRFVDYS
jgi:hypothetical protein